LGQSASLFSTIYWRKSPQPQGSASLPPSARKHYEDAQAAAQAGQLERAVTELQAAIRLVPRAGQLHSALAVVYDQQGKLRESNAAFREAARLSPHSTDALNNLALSHLKLQQSSEAIAAFTRSLAVNPKQEQSLVQLSQLYLATGQPQLALARLAQAQALTPNNPELVYLMIQAELAANDLPAAFTHVEKLRQLAPTEFNAHANVGVMLRERGQADAAIAQLLFAQPLAPGNEELAYQLALAWLDKKDGVSAERAVKKVPALANAARGLALLAQALTLQNKSAEAIAAIESALQAEPQSGEYQLQRGILLLAANGAAATRARYETQSRQLTAREQIIVGLSWLAEKRLAEAAQAFDASIALNGRDALARMLRGATAGQLGDFARAATDFNTARELDAANALAHFFYGYALMKQGGKGDLPAEPLRRALALKPNFAPAQRQLGIWYMEAGRLKEAESALTRAVQLDAQAAETHYQLGLLYRRLKQTARAQEELALFEKLKANDKQADVFQMVTGKP
jgi:tetratricopeptide (TPR) repeat protein